MRCSCAKGGWDIYLTGSNALLLSSDLATLFTGRHRETHILPFSFREYGAYFGEENSIDDDLDDYITRGGLAGSYDHQSAEVYAVAQKSTLGDADINMYQNGDGKECRMHSYEDKMRAVELASNDSSQIANLAEKIMFEQLNMACQKAGNLLSAISIWNSQKRKDNTSSSRRRFQRLYYPVLP